MSAASFFDFKAQITRPRGKANPSAPAGTEPLTVSQVTSQLTRAIRAGMPQAVLVKGEVSNFNHHTASGHLYFRLKDAGACIDCVMFKSDAARVKFDAADGMELIAGGRVDIFAKQGKYQLYVTTLQPAGQGALELAFQQLRAKLEAEGLFAPERKRPLPPYPIRIVIITSRDTAALQDVLKVLRRYPWLKLSICNVPVQGEAAGARIADAIRCMGCGPGGKGGLPDQGDGELSTTVAESPTRKSPPDVLLLVRGGGSLEDLWCFNEEAVARAIAASEVPVITGIGHEIDTSIADLVADYWAHTPTEAAQVLTRHWSTVSETLDDNAARLRRALRSAIRDGRQRLVSIERHELFRRPLDRINQLRQLLDDRQRGLSFAIAHRVAALRERIHTVAAGLERHGPLAVLARMRSRLNTLDHRLSHLGTQRLFRAHERVSQFAARLSGRHPRHRLRATHDRLDAIEKRLHLAMDCVLTNKVSRVNGLEKYLLALSPQRVLHRGYTITTRKKDGKILRGPAGLKIGERIITRFAEGEIESTVDDRRQPGLFE